VDSSNKTGNIIIEIYKYFMAQQKDFGTTNRQKLAIANKSS
jgi:hypothetical protein